MDILSIERERSILTEKLSSTASPRIRLLYLFHYYDKILNTSDSQLIESYLPEHIESYIYLFQHFNPIGIHPGTIKNILLQVDELSNQKCLKEYSSTLQALNNKLKSENDKISKVLEGIKSESVRGGKLCFPVIEQSEVTKNQTFGLLETITVQIKGAAQKTNFHITPSGKEIERAIGEQIDISWQLAVNNVKKYIRRIKPYHQVFIQFDHKYGEYVGNSLGMALALAFQKELLQFYNSPVIINYNGKVALTGGLNERGNILPVSEEVIKQKTATIFFSDVDVFVVNDDEKSFAIDKLEELQKEYPERSLKIIGVEDFDDVLNRRDIVEISKQKSIVRAGKYAKKHWISLTLMVLLVSVIYVAKLYDFDKNPEILVNEGYWLYVQNKNGKELWKKRMGFSSYVQYENQLRYVAQKIIDIDDDGTNEVILAIDDQTQYSPPKLPGRVACFSSDGNQIWEYYFRDAIASVEMVHSSEYSSYIIDTITINESKAIACFANNVLYPSAVYFLNLKTGKRIDSTMWHVGHLHSGIFKDLNRDGKMELIMTGLNNSLGRVVIFSIDFDKIGGQLPAVGDRKFKELPVAEVNNYVVLHKSDYTSYFGLKFNQDGWGAANSFFMKKKFNFIYLYEGQQPDYKGIMVEFSNDLIVNKIDISEGFEVARDALVDSGELQPPYSHTKEYLDILFKQIRFWDGTKFVTEDKLKNKSRP